MLAIQKPPVATLVKHSTDDPYLAIQLVKRAVGLDADVVFRHTGTTVDTGGAVVACPGIDSIQ